MAHVLYIHQVRDLREPYEIRHTPFSLRPVEQDAIMFARFLREEVPLIYLRALLKELLRTPYMRKQVEEMLHAEEQKDKTE